MSEMPKPDTKVDVIIGLSRGDLSDLCQAADDAIKAGGGFGWLTPPRRDVMETYWKGVLMVPERTLIVGRLDNVIVGSAQLVRPTKNNEAQAHSGQLTTSFMAPWARGHGLARMITEAVENHARKIGLTRAQPRRARDPGSRHHALSLARLSRDRPARALRAGRRPVRRRPLFLERPHHVILFPAIDLKDGQCVRLIKGDMAQATVFNLDPADQARRFADAGRRVAASGRSQRRVRGQAGECGGGRSAFSRR